MKLTKVVVATLIAAFFVSACASTQVTRATAPTGKKYPRPDHIVVHDFAATAADMAADPALARYHTGPVVTQTPEEVAIGRKLGALVANELVEEIRAMGLPGVHAADQTPQPGDLVLKGYFQSIDEGSAAKRVMLGFGSGAADLKTVVKGFEMTEQGLREVGSAEFDSGGGKGPGMVAPIAVAVATANPIGLVVGGAVKAGGELSGSSKIEGSAKRTAKAIGKELRSRFERQGWIED